MKRARGFSLLEVMVAVSILAVALVWLVEATSRAIVAENHAKLVSTATFLARGRLVELEDDLQEKGFTDDSFAKETSGDFEDKGFKRFKWTTVIDKIELPNTDQVQTLVSKGLEASPLGALAGQTPPSSSSSSTTSPLSGSTAMLASQFGIVKTVLEESIRRARVRITWYEGRSEQNVELVEYLTDPRRVDQSIAMPSALLGNGAPGSGPGAGGGTAATGGLTTAGSGTPGSTPTIGPGIR